MSGALEVAADLNVRAATTGFKFAAVNALKADGTKILLMRYTELLNQLQLGDTGINISVLGNWASDIGLIAGKSISIADLGGAGDRYVYCDNNGKLLQGAAYP